MVENSFEIKKLKNYTYSHNKPLIALKKQLYYKKIKYLKLKNNFNLKCFFRNSQHVNNLEIMF